MEAPISLFAVSSPRFATGDTNGSTPSRMATLPSTVRTGAGPTWRSAAYHFREGTSLTLRPSVGVSPQAARARSRAAAAPSISGREIRPTTVATTQPVSACTVQDGRKVVLLPAQTTQRTQTITG